MGVPSGKLTGEKVWLILDARAWEDPDAASVYCAFSSHKEGPDPETDFDGYGGDTLEKVKKARDEDWPDGVVFEYDEQEDEDGKIWIVNLKLIG